MPLDTYDARVPMAVVKVPAWHTDSRLALLVAAARVSNVQSAEKPLPGVTDDEVVRKLITSVSEPLRPTKGCACTVNDGLSSPSCASFELPIAVAPS